MITGAAMARFRFGGGVAESTLHPLVAVCLFITIVLILTLPRTKVITPFLIAFFTIPAAQILVVGGIHFTAHQILILTVVARMVTFPGPSSVRRFAGGFNAVDWVVVLWSLLELIMSVLQWMETQALIKSLGDLVVSLGGYCAARFLISDREAVRRTIKALAIICVIHGIFMMGEQFTRQNLFSYFGAVESDFRDGHVRAEGAMGTLWAGAFAGISIPLFFWLWSERNSKMAACMGLAGASAMAFASYASTSWLAYGASLVGLCLWPLRKQMQLVRWGLAAILAGLHLVMNGPVWSLIEKIDLTGGSSSYHRYMLVDNCIRHFGDWWLIGYKYYGDWGFDMYDLCNQFVVAALTGGLVTLVLFISIFKCGFAAIGKARNHVEGDRRQEWLPWCLGSSLFSLVVASFGINYMVYLTMWFFLLLSCICASTFEVEPPSIQTEEQRDDQQRVIAWLTV